MGADIFQPLLPAQAEFLANRTSPTLGFVGGWGSAKTYGGALKSLDLAQVNAPAPHLFIEPTYRQVVQVAERTVQEILTKWGVWPYVKFNRSDHTMAIPMNGVVAHIWFINGSNPDALAGINAGSAVVDEAGVPIIRPEFAQQVQARIRNPHAKVLQFCPMGTPDMGRRGWFFDTVEGDPDEDTHLVRAKTTDNVFLDEDYVRRRFRGLDEVNLRRYMNGEFVDLYGRVYTNFNEDKHCKAAPSDAALRSDRWRHVMFCDFGTRVMAWGFGAEKQVERPWEDSPAQLLHAIGEQVLDGFDLSTQLAANKALDFLSERYTEIYGHHIGREDAARMTTVYMDPAGNKHYKGTHADQHTLERMGFHVRVLRRHTSVAERVRCLQDSLYRDLFYLDKDRCPHLYRGLSQQGYDEYGRPEKGGTKQSINDLDHMLDGAGYWNQVANPLAGHPTYETNYA